ncbi:helix-turn-helix transcriptional regulator [uncultured Draconibacterium sp.]|uniref:helix-turn-helix domain-containing protein n=1 Tax=uncultured Draconibacterium sp. TaxID=1573823 RepID=UPI0025F35BB2|nr:helix-turn-helix transcriptional regulator [uncultured Draconibacterium sp.]
METSKRVTEIRRELNITQAELGRRLDESIQYINKVESGAINLKQATMIKLYQRLRVNLNWLLTGEGARFISPQD